MSSTTRGEERGIGVYSARSLKDELSSLRIERTRPRPTTGGAGRRVGEKAGLRFLSLLLWMIPLGLIGGAGYYAYSQYEKIRPKLEVTTAPVREMTVGEAETLLSAKGYLKSRQQAMIGAKVAGRVEKVLVEEGTKVKQGDLLAVLEHDDMDAILESRRAMIERSKAELEEARADLGYKSNKAERTLRLRSRGQAALEEAETNVAARDMAAARVKALEASISLQEASAREVEATIQNMNIIAPFDGTVVEKAAEVGETITPGGMGAASGRGSVVTLANLDQLEVETDIAENLLARVAIGQPAEVSVSAVPGKRYRGQLRRIVPMGDRARGTVKVYVEILDPDDRLFPELVATVHFLPDQSLSNPDAEKTWLFLPKSAIVEEAGHAFVWVVDRESTVRKQGVKVVVTEDDLARVEEGLKAGDTVVVAPPKTLRVGEAVKVAE